MAIKFCNTCSTDKSTEDFSKDKSSSDGLQAKCKKCYSEYRKIYYEENKEKEAKRTSQWKKDNRERITENTREYQKVYSLEYREKNKEKLAKDRKDYYEDNKEKIEAKAKLSRDKKESKERKRLYDKEYRKKTREKKNAREKELREKDPLHKITHSIRTRLGKVLKRNSWDKNSKFAIYIGCTLEFLMSHIERQFQPEMTFENYGEWHLDHIVPLSSAKTEEELYELCHYTNLQPLWALDNLIKGAKMPTIKLAA